MQSKICMQFYVSGRVQGVFFRDSTQKEAKALGITGWARNLPDGRVEILACGEKERIALLYHWLLKGPELAKVELVESKELPWEEIDRFSIK